MAGYFHAAAKLLAPDISDIDSIAGSKKAFLVKIGENQFRLNRLNVTTRLSFIRRLGAMLSEVDSLVGLVARGAGFQAKGMKAEALSEFTMAAPKIIAALCNERFEQLIIECARFAQLKTPKEFVTLDDDATLDEAIQDNTSYLIALGLCYLEVNAQDFLKQVAGTIQSRLQQTDVSISTSLPPATKEPQQ